MNKVAELRQRRATLLKSLQERHNATKTKVKDGEKERDGFRAMADEERNAHEGELRELETVKIELEAEERSEQIKREDLKLQFGREVGTEAGGPYRSLGEQMIDVAQAAYGKGEARAKLLEVRAPLGSNETIDSDGGYLVQKEFIAGLVERTYSLGQILPRVQTINVGANANGILMNGFDDNNLSNGVMGGIFAYWDQEAGTVASSKPKFRQIDMKLQKIRALCYATDELLEDSTALQSIINAGVPKAFQLKIENSIINGTGAGQCLGIMNCGAKITVPKESGQVAGTINFLNILKMYNRMMSDNRSSGVWFINQAIEPSLMTMVFSTGASSGVPVWMPAGGISGLPFATLFGRPIIPTMYNAALGTEGDIIFADLNQYLSITKGGLQYATSIHVQFLTGETAFRFTYRINGQPLWDLPFTPLQGDQTYSPYVTLATRA